LKGPEKEGGQEGGNAVGVGLSRLSLEKPRSLEHSDLPLLRFEQSPMSSSGSGRKSRGERVAKKHWERAKVASILRS